MNKIYKQIWSARSGTYVAVAETAKGRGKSGSQASTIGTAVASLLIAGFAISAGATATNALPAGGQVVAGSAAISTSANTLTVNQSTQRAAINWQSFSIGSGGTVNFVQPNASSVTLNRVVGNEQSVIAGALNANGQVFLLNSSGVLFTGTSSVSVGGIVASTLNQSDADFMAARNTFERNGAAGSVINLGNITTADGGYAALLGNQVSNQGVITARLGTAVLAAGDKVSLNFNGNSLVGVTIDQGTLNALVENQQAIRADGGLVILTAKGLDSVMRTVVNNTGEVRAQTIQNKDGKIYLLGGMDNDRIEVGGTLDASAPSGGNGGFVETSAAKVKFAEGVAITTAAPNGSSGKWLIDPNDFTVAASGGDITGTALGALLASNNIQIETGTSPTATATNLVGASGTNGDINVNDAVSWSANNTLTLNAYRNININADITATGTTGKLALYYGQGAVAASNTATYNLRGGHVNLTAGQNFDTKLGWDGTLVNWTVITSLGSAGSTTGTDLQGLDTGNASARTGNFALGANIDASATATWNSNGSGGYYGFQPIALPSSANGGFLNSRFDGLGHSIDSLYINRATVNTGLFSYVRNSTFSNLALTNVNVTGSAATGALIGRNDTIVGAGTSIIDQVFVSGTVTGTLATGGLVGRDLRGTLAITNSYSIATVSGTSYVGGLAGQFKGTIDSSFASGAVSGTSYVGGLVGNLVSDSSVSSGLFTYTPLANHITNSYFDSTTTGQTIAYSYDTGTNVSTPTVVTDTTGALANANAYTQASYTGFDFTSSGAWFSADGFTRPFLRMEGTNNISNAHQLQLMSMKLGSTNATSYRLAKDINLATVLTNQSEMWKDTTGGGSFQGSFVPIGYRSTNSVLYNFYGSLDGQQHTIDHLYIYRPNSTTPSINANSYVGLFGEVNGGSFSNLTLSNAVLTGYSSVGTLIGSLYLNTVSNIFITNSVVQGRNQLGGLGGQDSGSSITNAVVSNVSVVGTGDSAGGILGYAYGTHLLNSSATGSVSNTLGLIGGLIGDFETSPGLIANSNSSVSVSSTNSSSIYAGGLVGAIDDGATITNSYATGSVNGFSKVGGLVGGQYWNPASVSITSSYATGAVSGSSDVGGLAGSNEATISTSYATGNVTGAAGSTGGFVGTNSSNGNIDKSYGVGNVVGAGSVGGFAGTNNATISNSFAAGSVTGTGQFIGGFTGLNDTLGQITNTYSIGLVANSGTDVGGFAGRNLHTITNSFWDSQTSGYGMDGTGSTATGVTTANLQLFATTSSTTPPWDIVTDSYLANVYPRLRWATSGLSAGSSVWVIGTGTASSGASGSGGGSGSSTTTNAVANALITPPAFEPPLFTPGLPPTSGSATTPPPIVVNPLPVVTAVLGSDVPLMLVPAPAPGQPTQGVTLSQALAMLGGGGAAGGDKVVRVPTSRNSMEDIVNGGLNLPDGVEQELFVIQASLQDQ